MAKVTVTWSCILLLSQIKHITSLYLWIPVKVAFMAVTKPWSRCGQLLHAFETHKKVCFSR